MAADADSLVQTATLGGGCFWCLEAVFQHLTGVERVISGYAGGSTPQPSYAEVCGGQSGHIEVVQVQFDARQLRYRQLLEVFFSIHDPTSMDRQGYDAGTQYRSIIFVHDGHQREVARGAIAEVEAMLGRPVVTEVRALTAFWPAEPEHAQYYQRHPEQAYCRAVIAPKLAHFRETFAALSR